MINRICILLVLLGFVFSAAEAQKQIVTQTNSWATYMGSHRLSDRWGVYTEYSWRRSGLSFDNWMQSLSRVAVDYYTKSGAQLSVGYAFIGFYKYGAQPISYTRNEQRTFLQLITSQQLGRFYTSNRFRLEQRWLQNKTLSDGNYVMNEDDPFIYNNRLRYRYSVNVPLTKKTMEDNTLFLAMTDEVFINAGKEIKLNVFDQNRFITGLGWRLDKNRNIQVGYMNQYIVKGDAKKAERNNTLNLILNWGLDFRKSTTITAPAK